MSLKTLRSIGWMFLALALAAGGCAQNSNQKAPQGPAHISEEAARRERERPRIEAPPPPPPLRVVPGKGTCAPKEADNLVTLGSCCNDKACIGQCVAADGDKIECTCFDVRGGCSEGQVCCKFRRGCTLPKDCELP